MYEKRHDPCPRHQYTELVFNEPVRIRPGELRALYIHSTLPGDKAIVYDNSYYGDSDKRFEDDKLVILSGRAHVSTTCFGQDPIWYVSYCISLATVLNLIVNIIVTLATNINGIHIVS